MAEIKVIMPQMGESIVEGTLTKWLKSVGDPVKRDEPLFEISTDKIDSEIPSPSAGILKEILIGEDQTVEINTVVALIESAADTEADSPPITAPGKVPDESGADPSIRSDERDHAPDTAVRSSPLVRRLAAEHGIELSELEGKGTGAGGRITKRDIMSYVEQSGEGELTGTGGDGADTGDDERVPMSAMRRAIAEHMVSSRRVSAHVATVFEVDCSAVMNLRASLKPDFERAGTNLALTPFFVQAVAGALVRFPVLNSSVDGEDVVHHGHINIGVAVALDDGLLVPVIRDADKADLLAIARSVSDLANRARTKKLRPEDVQGGTFTLTNPGIFGGLYGIPIINQPQVAILAIGGIEKRPVVVGDAIAIRPMVYLALSFDHRIIDGAVADQFMADLKQRIQNWRA
jgi:2-oxoglutarate dehydrogenase E2 component (dihydrolipoamide succinyltransferase)